MCIAFMSISDDSERDGFKLFLAFNRDEFFNRPTNKLDWWAGQPGIISGIDMQTGKEGGTWLGMTKSGKIGMLTNYREAKQNPDAKGRGNLVSDYLKSNEKPRVFLEKIEKSGHEYGGFNLILGEVFPGKSGLEFSYYCNKEQRHLEDLNAGTYALSNRYLEYPWNKVVIGKQRFEEILKQNIPIEDKSEKVFEILSDKTRYGMVRGPCDQHLPDAFLEQLSAICVNIPEASYGTRTKSVIIIDQEDNATFIERTMVEPIDPKNPVWKTNRFEFKIEQLSQSSL